MMVNPEKKRTFAPEKQDIPFIMKLDEPAK